MRASSLLRLALGALLLAGCVSPPSGRPAAPEVLECVFDDAVEQDRCLARLAPYAAWDDPAQALGMCRAIANETRRDGCLRLTAVEVARREPALAEEACRSIADEDRRDLCLDRLIPWVDARAKVALIMETRPLSAAAIVLASLAIAWAAVHLVRRRRESAARIVDAGAEAGLAQYDSYYAGLYEQSLYAPPPAPAERPAPAPPSPPRFRKVRMVDEDGNEVETLVEDG